MEETSNIIFSVISVLCSIGSLVFALFFLFAFGMKKYKETIIYLILTILLFVLSICFKTSSVEICNIIIFIIGAPILALIGISLGTSPPLKQYTKGSYFLLTIATSIILALASYAFIADRNSGSSYAGTKTCKVCHKSFSDSANKNSIGSTNMCEDCYRNFEYGMKSTGQW